MPDLSRPVRRLPAAALMAVLWAAGACSAFRPAPDPAGAPGGISHGFRPGDIIRLESGASIPFWEMIRELADREVVFVGEIHDVPEHHLIQVQILQALTRQYGTHPAAMEFFERRRQAAIDSYMEGALDEEAFLKEVDWRGSWGFDYLYYRPLVLFTRDKGQRLVALNAPREIIRKVARTGLAGLDSQERKELAADIDLGNEAHKAYLRDIYKLHSSPDLKDFDRFYEAQCAWEDTMAETIADHLKRQKGRITVFCGNGHIMRRYGIPDRVTRRVSARVATVLLHPAAGALPLQKETGDYLWLTGHASRRQPAAIPIPAGAPRRQPENSGAG